MSALPPMTRDEAHTLLDLLSAGPGTLNAAVWKLLTDPGQKAAYQFMNSNMRVDQDKNATWKDELAEALSAASQVQPTAMASAYYEALRRRADEWNHSQSMKRGR